MARWVLRRGAIQWCWLTVSSCSFWAGKEAYNESQGDVNQGMAGALGGGTAGYLSHLAFIRLL